MKATFQPSIRVFSCFDTLEFRASVRTEETKHIDRCVTLVRGNMKACGKYEPLKGQAQIVR